MTKRPIPGCLNRPPLESHYWVKDGFTLLHDKGKTRDVSHRVKQIPHVMSTDCKSQLPECATCCNYRGPVVTEN